MRELSTGEMANYNCISKKALRVYHDMGLLRPYRIDADTGYRFYKIDQSATIDMIQHLQSLGASLAEIKDLIDGKNIDGLSELVSRKKAELSEKELRVKIAQYNAQKLELNCNIVKQDPVLDRIAIEHIPERRAIHFPILNSKAALLSDDVASYLDEWETNLRLTKRFMLESGIPVELFHNVGCCISQDDLCSGNLVLSSSYIFIDDEAIANHFKAQVVPECDYLTIHKYGYTTKDGRNSETDGVRELLRYAHDNDYRINGDYYGEIIADTPAFSFSGREMLYKLELPVRPA